MVTREESARILYGDFAPRDVPRYALAQAARFINLSPTTLRNWVRGRNLRRKDGHWAHFDALVKVESELLSFSHLVQVHILRSLRRDEDIRMSRLRDAMDWAKKTYHIERLLLSEQLRTAPGEILLDRYGELINAGRSGQLAIRHALEAHLKRVAWDAEGPTQFFPGLVSIFAAPPQQEVPRLILIDPTISLGKPVLASKPALRVSAIVDRVNAGEEEDEIARDYGIERREVDAAIDYEEAAAA
jgi:uncharacterized protein (DUF433 family)